MWILALGLLFAQNAGSLAQEVFNQAKTLEILATDIDLQIGKADAGLQWTCDGKCDFKHEVRGETLILRVTADKTVNLKLSALPLSVYANKAKVLVNGHRDNVKIRILEGTITATQTEGEMDLHGQKAHLSVNKHQGPLTIDLFEGDIYLDFIQGNLKLTHFSGLERLNSVQGEALIKTQKANTEIKDSKGKLTYESVKGSMNLISFQGEIRGESTQGQSVLSPMASSKLYWKADQGNVRLLVRRMNGAWVDVATKEGDMQLIPPLKVSNEGDWRVARAKLSGSEPGSVLVRTNKASIRIRSE